MQLLVWRFVMGINSVQLGMEKKSEGTHKSGKQQLYGKVRLFVIIFICLKKCVRRKVKNFDNSIHIAQMKN